MLHHPLLPSFLNNADVMMKIRGLVLAAVASFAGFTFRLCASTQELPHTQAERHALFLEKEISTPSKRPNPKKKIWDGGYLLSDGTLKKIHTIACLKEKAKKPWLDCGSEELEPIPAPYLSIGSYPSWRNETLCNSNGEFFCDPERLLKPEQRQELTDMLKETKEKSKVQCGQLESKMMEEDYSYPKNFNLAVAIAKDWPESESDYASLAKFGKILMQQWGLMPIYNGVDAGNGVSDQFTWGQYLANCPNSAVLIVLPKYNQVFLSAPSCEFICQERGGKEVAEKVVNELEAGDLFKAIKVGIDAVDVEVRDRSALSLQRNYNTHHSGPSVQEQVEKSEMAWTLVLRGALLIFVAICVLGLAVMVAQMCTPSPGGKLLRKT